MSENVVWVQQLAAQLVADGADSDDLAQEALLAWWAAPENSVKRLRAWLGTVLRNRARTEFRRASRQRRREQVHARPEAVPSTVEVMGRAEMHRELVDAVLALSEKSRVVLLYRYFEDLRVPTIALKLGVSDEAVRSRLRRAHEELRRSLDRHHGGREVWLASLGPLLAMRTGPTADAAVPATAFWGGVSMSAKTTMIPAVLGAALAVCGLLMVLSNDSEVAEEPPMALGERGQEPLNETTRVPRNTTMRAQGNAAGAVASSPAVPVKVGSSLGEVYGRVIDASGDPVVGLWVHAVAARTDREGGPLPVKLPAPRPKTLAGGATTDASGRYSLTDLAVGDYSLVVQGQGIRVTRRPGIAVLGGSVEEVDIVVLPGLAIRGVVLTPGGEPVVGARVTAERPMEQLWGQGTRVILGDSAREALGYAPDFEVATDNEGRFLMSGLDDVAYTITATLEPWAPTIESGVQASAAASGGALVELTMVTAASIVGTVVNEQGDPVADAIVVGVAGGGVTATIRTDVEGHFELSGLVPGSVELRGHASDFVPMIERGIRVEAGVATEVTLVLEAGVAISGLVVDSAGNPIPGARVRVRPVVATNDETSGELQAVQPYAPGVTTTSDGAFELNQLRSGVEYRGDVRALGYTTGIIEPFVVPDGGGELPEVVLGEGARWTGVVVDAAGDPVLGADVQVAAGPIADGVLGEALRERLRAGASTATTRTDAAGQFELRGVTPGQRRLRVSARGYTPYLSDAVELTEGQVHDVTVVLERGLEISGVVVDSNGQPVSGAKVAFHRSGQLGAAYQLTTNEEGRFEKSGLGTEAFELRVSAVGLAPWSESNVSAPQQGLKVVLSSGATLLGTVLDEGKQLPLADFTVKMFRADGGTVERLLSRERAKVQRFQDVSGRFDFHGLASGKYDVEFSARGYVSTTQTVEVRDAEAQSLTVQLIAGATLTGRVVDSQGLPIVGAKVAFAEKRDPRARLQKTMRRFQEKFGQLEQMKVEAAEESGVAITDKDGRFALRDVPTGAVSLQVSHRKHLPETIVGLDAVSGEERTVPTVVLRKGRSIAGRVLQPDGKPALFATLLIYEIEPSGARKRPKLVTLEGRNGRFAKSDLRPARYAITVHGSGASQRIRIDLSANAPADAIVDLRDADLRDLELTLQ
ncbi:MAG: sigma-70 family RNA polymerase sigma factor [Planctomycetota bacterium]